MKKVVLFFILNLCFENSFAQAPANISVTQVRTQGGGCPTGTVAGNISPDGSAFSLLMDNYLASANGNRQLDRQMCDVMVDLAVAPGWSYAIISADYRGFVNVAAGSIATHQALYSFDGSKPINERPGFENGRGHVFRAHQFRGPITDNYYIRDDLPIGLAPWSPCVQSAQTTLHISTYLMARSLDNLAQTEATITLDSIDGSIQSQNYQIIWRKCHGGGGVEPRPRPNPRPDPFPEPRPNPRPDPFPGHGPGPRPGPRPPRF